MPDRNGEFDLSELQDEQEFDLADIAQEPINPGSWTFPRGMEHLDPSRPGAYEMAQPSEDAKTIPVDWPNPLRAVKEGLQKYVGGPASEAALGIMGFDPDSPLPGGLTLEGTSEEAVARSAMSAYGAKPPSEASQAQLTYETGGTGMSTPEGPQPGTLASGVMKGAAMVGEIPLYTAVPNFIAPGAKLGLLAHAGARALEGGALGGLSAAASKDQSVLQGIGEGALISGGLTLGAGGIQTLLRSSSKVAKAAMPVLVERPTINESLLQARLEQEAARAREMATGIEVPDMHLESGEAIPATQAKIRDPATGKLTWEGAASFDDAARHNTAAVSASRAGKASVPQSAGYVEPALPRTQSATPTSMATPATIGPSKITPNPQSVAAAANAATPPPPPNSPPIPVGPVPIAPGMLSHTYPAAFKDIQDMTNKVRMSSPSIWGWVKEFLLSPGVRGEPGVRHIANEAKVSRSLVKMSEDSLAAVESGLGKYKQDFPFRKALSDLADGKIDIAQIEANHPEAWKKVRDIIEPTMLEIDQNSKILGAMGYVPNSPSWLADPEVSKYAARSYLSKTAPKGQWGKVAPQDVVDRGIDYIAGQSGKAAQSPEGRQQIANEVLDLLNSGKSWEDIVGSPDAPAWTKPFKNLKGRQQLPSEIRGLLGEIEDGPYRIAHTIGTQRALIAQLSIAREVAANPQYTSLSPKIDGAGKWVQMPDLASLGPLKGTYVRPDVAAALGNAAHVAPRVSQITSKLMRFMKANVTVGGGVPAWTHEFLGNLDNAMLSGGFDITRPVATGKSFMRADKLLRAYFKNPSSPEARDMVEIFRLGAADMGWSRAEMRQANQNMIALMQKQLAQQKGQTIWHVADALKGIVEGGQKLYAKSGQAWDMVSLHMRTASYLNLRDKFILQGMAPEQARRQAAQRVIMSFPSPHNLSAGVENMRSSALGFMAPFTTYLAEDARIRLQIPQRIAEGEVDLPIRMAIHYGILGGAIAGASAYGMHKYGVSSAELEAANAEVTRDQGFYRPMQWAIPYRDDQGRLQVTDFTWLNPAFRLPQGDVVDPLWKRLATNTLLYPLEGGAAERPVRELAQAAGLGQMPPQYQLRPGESGLLVFLDQLNRSGFGGPAAVSRITTLAKQAGQVEGAPNPYRETMGAEQVAATTFGFPTKPVTVPQAGEKSPQMAARAVEFQRNIKDLTQALRSAVASGDQDRVAKVRAMIDATIADFKNVQQKVQAAQKEP